MKIFSRFKSALEFNYILVATVPFVIIGFLILTTMTRNLEKEITNDQLILSRSLAREVEQFLYEPLHLLGQIEEVLERKGLISDWQINSYLDSIMVHYPFLR